jgi:hypothetical protein
LFFFATAAARHWYLTPVSPDFQNGAMVGQTQNAHLPFCLPVIGSVFFLSVARALVCTFFRYCSPSCIPHLKFHCQFSASSAGSYRQTIFLTTVWTYKRPFFLCSSPDFISITK